MDIVEVIAKALCAVRNVNPYVQIDNHPRWMYEQKDAVVFKEAIEAAGMVMIPKEPTAETIERIKNSLKCAPAFGDVAKNLAIAAHRAMLTAKE